MKIRVLITIAALALVATPAAHAADTPTSVSETSALDSTAATISFTQTPDPTSGVTAISALHLTIVRDGVKGYDADLNIAGCAAESCTPYPVNGINTKLRVLVYNVDDDAEPEVLISTFSGGAHCCESLTVFDYRAAAFHKRTYAFNDAGARLVNLDHRGQVELASGDWRYAYAFTSYAGSWQPTQTFRLIGPTLVDVSRQFPMLLKRDAAAALKIAKNRCTGVVKDGDNLGVWSGWAADEYRLGRRTQALATLRAQMRAGCVVGPTNLKTYIARLDRFVRAVSL